MQKTRTAEPRDLRLLRVIACLLFALSSNVGAGRAQAADDAAPPIAISFPRDDGPHLALTEWWYYTGHLETADGRLYGFEQVTFKAIRGFASGYAAHVAITDPGRQRFAYDQRAVYDDGTIAKFGAGFDFTIGDWSMRGVNGVDELAMTISGYSYVLSLISQKPPVLHGGDGYLRTDAGAESYYYSRTRLSVTGMITVDGVVSAVTGAAWMDHQWGGFTSFSVAGWDWFSIQLDDGTEVMIYQLRDELDSRSLLVATYVRADGTSVDLTENDLDVSIDEVWRSPESLAIYPAAWTIRFPSANLELTLAPTVANQELDTRETTGVTYWEGQVLVSGTKADVPIEGRGYVELTGYARGRDGVVP